MALVPALPSPIPRLAKWIIKHPDVLIPGLATLYDYISDESTVANLQWRYVVLRFSRATPVGTVEDYAQFGMNITNITGGQLDTTWTAGDYANVDSALNELVSSVLGIVSNSHTLIDYRYYLRAFNPALPLGLAADSIDPATKKAYQRFAHSGPALHVVSKNAVGGATAQPSAYQVAASVTFKTPAPRHWGRVYFPGVTAGELGALYGRFTAPTTTLLANAFAEFQDDLQAQDFQLVVPSTQQSKLFAVGLQGVTSVVMDDIPDVIRRRRPKQASVRTIGVPTP